MRSLSQKLSLAIVLLGCVSHSAFAAGGVKEESSYRLLTQTQRDEVKKSVEDFMEALTPDQKSAMQEKLNEEKKLSQNPYGLVMYEPPQPTLNP